MDVRKVGDFPHGQPEAIVGYLHGWSKDDISGILMTKQQPTPRQEQWRKFGTL
jgi:hypothetical protein